MDKKKDVKPSDKLFYHQKRQCPKCGAWLSVIIDRDTICNRCGHEEKSDYGKIKEFIYDNGASPANIISLATGVSEDIIDFFLKEEYIEVAEDSPTFFTCEICGNPIRTGRVCPACSKKQMTKLKGVYNENPKSDSPNSTSSSKKNKMRFIGTDRHF